MKKITVILLVLCAIPMIVNAQNNALDFDGVDDYVVSNSFMDLTYSALTFECWIKVDAFKTAPPYITTIMGTEETGHTALLRIGDTAVPNDIMQLNLRFGSGAYNMTANTSLQEGIWYHVAAVYDGSTMKIFINGNEDASVTAAYGEIVSNRNFYLGRSYNLGRCLDGKMDEVRVWSVARTETEISENMYNELIGTEPGLVAYYKLNTGSGQTALDTSGSNNGILGSTTGIDVNDPTWFLSDSPLPVTLTDFSTAVIMNEFVQISWTTQTEASINTWNLYRETENSTEYILIYSQAGTNTTQPYTYIFEDHEVAENVVYYYYLESTEYDGTSNMWGPISAILEGSSIPEFPETSILESNYPNPFNPSTTIKCDIREGEEGILTIYNLRGHEIEKQILSAGEHILEWDGSVYGSGVYLYKLETNSYTQTKKMIMLK
ncbi:MAG: LamG-like jellyroll fold domain-containing protein [Candidatus Cloacimonadota bacterium]|nr:LamG-like jellyroll fold domain-containing protein [Candidatus Cloacimonadota bacterium]